MLQLIQIMNYMLQHLEYSKEEVEEHFIAVESKALSLKALLDILNIEPYTPTIMAMLHEKLPKWRSALAVTLKKLEDQ